MFVFLMWRRSLTESRTRLAEWRVSCYELGICTRIDTRRLPPTASITVCQVLFGYRPIIQAIHVFTSLDSLSITPRIKNIYFVLLQYPSLDCFSTSLRQYPSFRSLHKIIHDPAWFTNKLTNQCVYQAPRREPDPKPTSTVFHRWVRCNESPCNSDQEAGKWIALGSVGVMGPQTSHTQVLEEAPAWLEASDPFAVAHRPSARSCSQDMVWRRHSPLCEGILVNRGEVVGGSCERSEEHNAGPV